MGGAVYENGVITPDPTLPPDENAYVGQRIVPPRRGVTYREFDVGPRPPGARGRERLIIGSDGSAWFTFDHYRSPAARLENWRGP